MNTETPRAEAALDDHHAAEHPFALGVLAGAAVGVGIGLLFAPRTGAQMRQSIGNQLTNVKGSCSAGYHRAKGVAGEWAGRGHQAYDTTREKVVHGARETWQYVREVSEAVTRKSHHEAAAADKVELPGAPAREPARAVLAHGSGSAPRPAGITDVPVKEVTAKQRA
jgi:gas vesicle protein